MPTSRQPHDPFIDAPLRPTSSNATSLSTNPALRAQTSQHSLRSNASTASARTRQQRDLFAPSLSRRPTSRATPRVEDEVLVDSDTSEHDLAAQRQRQLRRIKHGSPEGKHSRLKGKQEEEMDFVNRQPDGSYLLGVSGVGESGVVPAMTVLKTEEELQQEDDDEKYTAMAHAFFASGASLGRGSKKHEEELEEERLRMMLRLRQQVMEKLERERWQYKPTDRVPFHDFP